MRRFDTQEYLAEIMTHWGLYNTKLIKVYHPDFPRIVARINTENGDFIIKGIQNTRDGVLRGEQTIYGNVAAHRFLGNQKGIAPKIYPIKDESQKYYFEKDGYWFYLIEYIDGRPMQDTADDELLLGNIARTLHSLREYFLPSSLNENKQRFYAWFHDKPFKAAFDALLNNIPDFSKHDDRCIIHTDIGPHNAVVRSDGKAVLIDLDDCGIGSRYLDLGWAFIMQFVEHTNDMQLSYRFDLAQAFLKGYYGTAQIAKKEYDLLWQGAVYMHISYMQSYGSDAVDSLWEILQFGLTQKPILWKMINDCMNILQYT